MKKLYILRGHPGSGKSYFSKQLIKEYQKKNIPVFELNNDDYIIEQFGEYKWSPKNIEKAMKYNDKQMVYLMKDNQSNKKDCVIISSNMNVRNNKIISYIQQAKKYGFEVEIVRFKNFYQNNHSVKDNAVINIALTIEENNEELKSKIPQDYQDKIKFFTLESKNDISPEYEQEMNKKLEEFKILLKNNDKLTYDNQRNTYVTDEFIKLGLFKGLIYRKESEQYKGLFVYKYSNKVFYENLFNEALLEMRGLVLDEENNIIIRPFKKIFNYSERVAENTKYPIEIHDNQPVKLVKKLNGFLGVATSVITNNKRFNGEVLYSTTGSLDSNFAEMAKRHLVKYEKLFKQYPNHTFLFEILDEDDPHIIKEEFGEVLIGMIDVKTGEMATEEKLNEIAKEFEKENNIKLRRPEILFMTFGEAKELLKIVKHEGFMVYADNSLNNQKDELLFKMKSPFYLVSKFLGRMKNEKLEDLLKKEKIDEEYYEVIEHIKSSLEEFKEMNEQEKIVFIQSFLEEKFYKKEEKVVKQKHLKL